MEDAIDCWWEEVTDAVKHSATHRTAPPNKLSGQKHEQGQGGEGLDSMPGSLNCDLRISRVHITSELVRDSGPDPEPLNEILWFNKIPK